ncbi:MAG: hypothetical protein WBE37_06400 [Bryobacteraceae bacterium]
MRQRFTTWIAALLMLAATSAGAPAARITISRETSSIVCVIESVGTAQEVLQIRRIKGLPQISAVARKVSNRSVFSPASVRETSLFQRPPPSHPRLQF